MLEEGLVGLVAVKVEHQAQKLKSRWTERRDDPEAALRRGREATAARDRVLELFPEPAEAG